MNDLALGWLVGPATTDEERQRRQGLIDAEHADSVLPASLRYRLLLAGAVAADHFGWVLRTSVALHGTGATPEQVHKAMGPLASTPVPPVDDGLPAGWSPAEDALVAALARHLEAAEQAPSGIDASMWEQLSRYLSFVRTAMDWAMAAPTPPLATDERRALEAVLGDDATLVHRAWQLAPPRSLSDHLHRLVNRLRSGFVIASDDGVVLFHNPSACRILGVACEALVLSSLRAHLADWPDEASGASRTRVAGDQQLELSWETMDDGTLHLLVDVSSERSKPHIPAIDRLSQLTRLFLQRSRASLEAMAEGLDAEAADAARDLIVAQRGLECIGSDEPVGGPVAVPTLVDELRCLLRFCALQTVEIDGVVSPRVEVDCLRGRLLAALVLALSADSDQEGRPSLLVTVEDSTVILTANAPQLADDNDSLAGDVTALCAEAGCKATLDGARLRVTLPMRAAAPCTPNRKRVLVIDDERAIGISLKRALGRDHDVTALTDPAEAVRLIEDGSRYDVLLCDLMMPAMTGMEVYRKIREMVPDQAERMIFMTAATYAPSTRAFLAGVPNLRFNKPFDLQELRDVVQLVE